MARVTGIGGIFFKSTGDKKALCDWYHQHLGLELEPWGGAILKWPQDLAQDQGATVWSAADADTKWFAPSTASFMVNYRVDDMAGMLANLERAGIAILQGPEFHENGVFAWLMDPDGNKIELWEPKIWDAKNKRA